MRSERIILQIPTMFMRQIRGKNPYLDELEALARRKTYPYCALPRPPLTMKSEWDYLERNKIKPSNPREKEIEPTTSIDLDQKVEIRLNSLSSRFVKRFCDLVGSLIALIITIPIWIIVPILIKFDSRGPVFYTQTRVGRNRRDFIHAVSGQRIDSDTSDRERRRDDTFGKTFRVLKFRTMVDNAERDSGPVWAAQNDFRITRLGALLRKLRLDEIPQFINVLLGEMSIVGPRPERPSFVKDLSRNIDGYLLRLHVKPGITGLAQIKGTYDSSPATVARKLKFDLDYIDNWSLWLDIKILFQTVLVVLTGRGAH